MPASRSLPGHIVTAPMTKSAVAVLLVGWAPLLVVGYLGPEDANPIGLGLFAVAATSASIGLAIAGILQGIRRCRTQAKAVHPTEDATLRTGGP